METASPFLLPLFLVTHLLPLPWRSRTIVRDSVSVGVPPGFACNGQPRGGLLPGAQHCRGLLSQEIRSAYRALVKKWHPDKHPPSSRPEAEAKFKAISQAYEALNDQQENRSMVGAINDRPGGGVEPRHRSQDLQKPRCAGNSAREFKDEYRSAKAGAVAGPAAAVARPAFCRFRTKPPPVERKLECTLEELCRGCKKEIKFTRNVITNKGLIVRKEETQTVRVKPGWKKGTKITFEGMGDERPGCLPADAVFVIAEKEHPVFKRKGNELVMKVEVPLVNALTGWFFSSVC
ncbi:hypothetical protein MUK42_10824 [Musa troglodytarum]|uniref:J domain-containing protein n=1 Tax=Musa troglodytarum TaxID=320322 RepID=A0A9E7GBT7_9LILI|nr:hypothetical protein MUK42_10824 [Musa troglodytarum]